MPDTHLRRNQTIEQHQAPAFSLFASLKSHILKCFIAGIVAILPVAGVIVTIVWFENQVAGSWLKEKGFYFFGLGVLIAIAAIYLIGLTISTFIGRWIWNRVDRVLDSLPVLGNLYVTLKQVLGYGNGPGGLFQRVVLVPFQHPDRYEIGLVTVEPDESNQNQVGIFLPASPTPTSGRLIYVQPGLVKPTNLTASEAMQLLVSMGTIQPDSKTRSNENS